MLGGRVPAKSLDWLGRYSEQGEGSGGVAEGSAQTPCRLIHSLVAVWTSCG
jgi:hypothetical protein